MKRSRVLTLGFAGCLIVSAVACIAAGWMVLRPTEPSAGCQPLPEGFAESDLFGTWAAEKRVPDRTMDYVLIAEDGTYSQTILSEDPLLEYVGTPHAWWFERSDSGIGYLHLDSFRPCAASPSLDCNWTNDGVRPWADVCGDRWITPPPGEMILTVQGYPAYIGETEDSHPFTLVLYLGFESSPWVYGFEKP